MLYCIIINGLLCTPLMMVQMSFFQLVSGDLQGWPTKTGTMFAVISTYIVLVIANMLLFSDEGSKKDNRDMLPPKSKIMDKVVGFAMVAYFTYLTINMALGTPESHISTGVHQTIGPCDVMA